MARPGTRRDRENAEDMGAQIHPSCCQRPSYCGTVAEQGPRLPGSWCLCCGCSGQLGRFGTASTHLRQKSFRRGQIKCTRGFSSLSQPSHGPFIHPPTQPPPPGTRLNARRGTPPTPVLQDDRSFCPVPIAAPHWRAMVTEILTPFITKPSFVFRVLDFGSYC